MQFTIHDFYVRTQYGDSVWDNLRPELVRNNPNLNLAESFVSLIESKPFTSKMLVHESLRPYFHRLGLTAEIEAIPDSFEKLLSALTPVPIWVLSASTFNRGLIAVQLSSQSDFELTENSDNLPDLTIAVAPTLPVEQMESFNLSRTKLCFQQQALLSLVASHALRESEYFQSNNIGLILKDKHYTLKSQQTTSKFSKEDEIDFECHFYLNQASVRHYLWNTRLEQSQLREPAFINEYPVLNDFKKWAETWINEPITAMNNLKTQPASAFLFQALALHADPRCFLEHVDKLVLIDFLEIREAMELMFGIPILTRPGLSFDDSDKFTAYDPNHVRALCETLPSNHRKNRVEQTRTEKGCALTYWRRCENNQSDLAQL